MGANELFKAAFLPKKNLARKLQTEVDAALDTLKAARAQIDELPDSERAALQKPLDDLEAEVMQQVTRGTTHPGDAWLAMPPLRKRIDADAQRVAAHVSDAAMDRAAWLAAVRRSLAGARKLCQDIRKDKDRQPLLDKALRIDQKLSAEAQTASLDELKTVRDEARQLLDDARDAAGKPKQPKVQAAVSSALVNDVKTIGAIGARLDSPAKDPQGRTAAEELEGRLAVFDTHFAADGKTDLEAARRNKAMRLAAVTSVTANRMAMDLNDPYLVGRIGQSLVDEYAPDIGGLLSRGDDDDEADGAIQLAQALVMDDPIGKLMFDRIDPADAVQRIRDMAEVAGEPPSVMLALLRQQFEMKIGSLTRAQVKAGEKKDDADADGNFALAEITGEISRAQFSEMVDTQGTAPTDTARWKEDVAGLDFKAARGQTHTVVAGDTLSSLAQTYYGDPAQADRIRFTNLGVIVRKPAATRGGPDIVERKGLRNVGRDEALPVGAVLIVPSKKSVLDLLEAYVAAWDTPDAPADSVGVGNDEAEPLPDQLSARQRKKAAAKAPLKSITPEMLKVGAAGLTSPRDTQPDYIQAPGLGQAHKVRAPLANGPVNADPLHGQINERQYAHLRMLARSDQEDREAIFRRTGQSVDETVHEKLKERYGIDDDRARRIAANVAAWIRRVPLTITFNAASLFSDPARNAPTHGEKYQSEVVFSRGTEDKKAVIGRDEQGSGTMGTQGGSKTATGWKTRGENYMRWRRDKDAREGRKDELAYEDQQIFGAANPTFGKGKGSVAEKPDEFGVNYYGDAHFLLKDDVRNRCAFAIRSKGTSAPLQRQDPGMVVYDLLTGSSDGSALFMDALLQMENRSDAITLPGLTWEVHFYGGFDCSKDAAAIYLSSGIEAGAANRIRAFARQHGIACQDIGARPPGLDAQAMQPPRRIDLSGM
jgi:hypothetical protein